MTTGIARHQVLQQPTGPIGFIYECEVDGQIVMSGVPCDQWGYYETTDTMMPPLWLIPGQNNVNCTGFDAISYAGSQMSPHVMGDIGTTSVCVYLRGGLTYFTLHCLSITIIIITDQVIWYFQNKR